MGHANIYIRKENELAWESITDKSAWVNERLDKWHPGMGISDTHKGIPKVIKKKQDTVEAVKEVFPDAKPISYKPTNNWGA